jgi:uncharacterized protein GlcG (DUF336 family)
MQGGILIFKGRKIIAAIGVGGSMPATDEKIAKAGGRRSEVNRRSAAA